MPTERLLVTPVVQEVVAVASLVMMVATGTKLPSLAPAL